MDLLGFLSGVGAAIGFLGSIASLIGKPLISWASKDRDSCYYIRSWNIFNQEDINEEDIQRLQKFNIFNRKWNFNCLKMTKVAFWNAGKRAIRGYKVSSGGHIDEKDPLRLQLEQENRILSAKTIHAKRFDSGFQPEIDKSNSQVRIKFPYLNQGEGLVIQVIHTEEIPEGLEIIGTLLDFPNPRKVNNVNLQFPAKFALITLCFSTALLFYPLLEVLEQFSLITILPLLPKLAIWFVLPLFLEICIFLVFLIFDF